MSLFDGFRKWPLQLELRYLRTGSFLKNFQVLRFFNRKITADISVIASDGSSGIRFRIDFRSPYFKLPVAIEKTQIGRVTASGSLETASFRLFDWQSWAHIDGRIEWHGEQVSAIGGNNLEFITGFSYSAPNIPADGGNLGIRLAEGVDGTVRVLAGGELVQCSFEPGYWMLEPDQSDYKIVAIRDTELMVLIVSLSEIGSGRQRLQASAMQNLHQWVSFKLGGKSREQMLLGFLKYVRDWGPLGMEPLFRGLGETLLLLGLENQEQVIFEFYADNWGVHNNWYGRLLAVRILEVLATKKAVSALNAIFDYVKNSPVEAEELEIICRAIRRISENSGLPESAVHP